MKNRFWIALAPTVLAILASGPAWAGRIASGVSVDSIDGAGRNIMRTADGGIVAAFSTTDSGLTFARSLDNGASWNNFAVEGVDGSVVQVAIDSNFQGSYIAFTENANDRLTGRIAFSFAPFAPDPQLAVSAPVTPAGVIPRDTFLQASRAGWGDRAADDRETVVYGWQDSVSKGLYIGVSPDGRTFPMAQLVVEDAFAASGPAVAIRGNYVVATYLTSSPAIAPADVPAEMRRERTYPAWIESLDGGQTWSKPRPLFGLTSAAFPQVRVETAEGGVAEHRLAGGSDLPNSPILNWASSRDLAAKSFAPDKTLAVGDSPSAGPRSDRPAVRNAEFDPSLGGTTFVQTSMRSIDGDGTQGEVSIVSFRPIEPGAQWTHAIANNRLTENMGRVDSRTSHLNAQGSQFQYSALIDTAVRATTYQDFDPATRRSRLVTAVSTDTGKTFNHHMSFSSEELAQYGITGFWKGSVFAVSQCLFEDRDGEVYVDLLHLRDGEEGHFASLPIGVNAAMLRRAEQEEQQRLERAVSTDLRRRRSWRSLDRPVRAAPDRSDGSDR